MIKQFKSSMALLFLSLFAITLFAQTPEPKQETERSWYESLGDVSEDSQQADNELYIIDNEGESVIVEVIGHDDYTEEVIENYTSGKDFQYDKTNRVAFMQLVGIKKKEGTQHYLQVIEDNGFGFMNVYNRKAKRKAQLKRYVKRIAKWKVRNPEQRFAHWFNSQFTPTAFYFTAFIGEEKPIDKVVKDAPLFLAQQHLERVNKGYIKHKVTAL